MAKTSGSAGSPSAGASRAWPVFRSLQAYRPNFFTHDLFAGLTLAAIAIPEQMATARLGGFPPPNGFFRVLGGPFAVAAFVRHPLLALGRDFTLAPVVCCGLGTPCTSRSV